MYYVYILRCEDNSLYTGITTDVERRFREHKSGDGKGAKYTKSHKPTKIEAVWETVGKPEASKLEYKIKRLTKTKKETLIRNNSVQISVDFDIKRIV